MSSLAFNADAARRADKQSSIIRETGKYVGTITRAEKLESRQGTKGVGFSFKTDDGATASYLDIYTEKKDGTPLFGADLVQSVLCCARVKDAPEGQIKFERWSKEDGAMVECTSTGYPALMGKRIGFVLQRTLETRSDTGEDTDKMVLVRVFEASSGLTSTEILDGKTKGEKLDKFMAWLAPVNDRRKDKKAAAPVVVPMGTGPVDTGEFDQDIPF